MTQTQIGLENAYPTEEQVINATKYFEEVVRINTSARNAFLETQPKTALTDEQSAEHERRIKTLIERHI